MGWSSKFPSLSSLVCTLRELQLVIHPRLIFAWPPGADLLFTSFTDPGCLPAARSPPPPDLVPAPPICPGSQHLAGLGLAAQSGCPGAHLRFHERGWPQPGLTSWARCLELPRGPGQGG